MECCHLLVLLRHVSHPIKNSEDKILDLSLYRSYYSDQAIHCHLKQRAATCVEHMGAIFVHGLFVGQIVPQLAQCNSETPWFLFCFVLKLLHVFFWGGGALIL